MTRLGVELPNITRSFWDRNILCFPALLAIVGNGRQSLTFPPYCFPRASPAKGARRDLANAEASMPKLTKRFVDTVKPGPKDVIL